MVKAGLLAWLRILPLGELALPSLGAGVLLVGLVSAFAAVAFGLLQEHPKVVLAYSTVSQMGLLVVAIGVVLLEPATWPVVLPGILVHVAHNALSKGALFLSVGVVPAGQWSGKARILLILGLLIPAVAIAGAPVTTGSVAKLALKYSASLAPVPWGAPLQTLLPISGVATMLLLCRFLWLVWPASPDDRRAASPASVRLWGPWAILSLLLLLTPWGLLLAGTLPAEFIGLDLQSFWKTIWPVTVGAVLALAVWRTVLGRTLQNHVRCAPGDILLPARCMIRLALSAWDHVSARPLYALQRTFLHVSRRVGRRLLQAPRESSAFESLAVGGVCALAIVLLFLFAGNLALPRP